MPQEIQLVYFTWKVAKTSAKIFAYGSIHIAQIFLKRVNARVEIRHTNPLQCSNCKKYFVI